MRILTLMLKSIGKRGEGVPKFYFQCIIASILFTRGAYPMSAANFNASCRETEYNTKNDTCSTEICVDAAIRISNSMNASVDPCNNFYEFVCGNFGNEAQGFNDSGQVDQFSIILDQVQRQIVNLIDKDTDPREPHTFKLIKTYYHSCLNTTDVELKGLEPLQEILNKLGGWPVVLGDSWKEQNFSWQQTDQTLRSLGYSTKYIFHIFAMKDVKNSSKNILYVGPSDTDFKDLSRDNKVLKAYKDYMIDVSVLLGADKDRAKLELDEVLTFEMRLLSATYSTSTKPDTIVDYAKVEELQNLHAYVSWLEYLNNATHHHFQDDDKVYIENPNYLEGLKDLLANSKKRVIANYLLWRTVYDSVYYLNSEIIDKRSLFDRSVRGTVQVQTRRKKCLQAMTSRNGGLLPGISAMYTRHFFKNGTKGKIAKMVTDLRTYYMDTLKESSHFSQNMTSTALRKNEALKEVIGYPDELADMEFLEKYYEKLNIRADNLFENTLKIQKFVSEKVFDRLMKSPNETFWLDVGVAADVQIFYHALYNAIVLPASVLQYPFFDENLPNYLNYGSSGFFIGHEISHAFVFGEIPTDEYGIVRMWWTMEDQEDFATKAQCFLSHYNNFTKATNKSIGRKTMNENIADNEGVKAAISAYRAWKLQNRNELRLPCMNYTDEQLFWINSASTLCTRRTEELSKFLSFNDEHPSEEMRVNGFVSNSRDFSQAFKCQTGTPMNPEQKCSFWQ